MTDELEVTPKTPPDWRDWINEFPTIKAVALTCVIAWIITPLVMTVAGWLIGSGFIDGQSAIDGVLKMISIWLDALNWLTLAAVFGVVGKRATEKPDLVRAEGEVRAAQTVAAAQADAVKSSAIQPALAPAAQRAGVAPTADEAAILAAEEAARIEKHKINPPIATDGD